MGSLAGTNGYLNILYSQCTGFRYIQVFDHLNCKLTVPFWGDIFIIFENEYAITLNQRLCGFNFAIIFLIILVAFVLILFIVRLHCHIENR